jgi:hypothetical protein
MIILNFTVEQINIIAIYKADTLGESLNNISDAFPYMDDDILVIAKSAYEKLATLTEEEFDALKFTLADEYEGVDTYA